MSSGMGNFLDLFVLLMILRKRTREQLSFPFMGYWCGKGNQRTAFVPFHGLLVWERESENSFRSLSWALGMRKGIREQLSFPFMGYWCGKGNQRTAFVPFHGLFVWERESENSFRSLSWAIGMGKGISQHLSFPFMGFGCGKGNQRTAFVPFHGLLVWERESENIFRSLSWALCVGKGIREHLSFPFMGYWCGKGNQTRPFVPFHGLCVWERESENIFRSLSWAIGMGKGISQHLSFPFMGFGCGKGNQRTFFVPFHGLLVWERESENIFRSLSWALCVGKGIREHLSFPFMGDWCGKGNQTRAFVPFHGLWVWERESENIFRSLSGAIGVGKGMKHDLSFPFMGVGYGKGNQRTSFVPFPGRLVWERE